MNITKQQGLNLKKKIFMKTTICVRTGYNTWSKKIEKQQTIKIRGNQLLKDPTVLCLPLPKFGYDKINQIKFKKGLSPV